MTHQKNNPLQNSSHFEREYVLHFCLKPREKGAKYDGLRSMTRSSRLRLPSMKEQQTAQGQLEDIWRVIVADVIAAAHPAVAEAAQGQIVTATRAVWADLGGQGMSLESPALQALQEPARLLDSIYRVAHIRGWGPPDATFTRLRIS